MGTNSRKAFFHHGETHSPVLQGCVTLVDLPAAWSSQGIASCREDDDDSLGKNEQCKDDDDRSRQVVFNTQSTMAVLSCIRFTKQRWWWRLPGKMNKQLGTLLFILQLLSFSQLTITIFFHSHVYPLPPPCLSVHACVCAHTCRYGVQAIH